MSLSNIDYIVVGSGAAGAATSWRLVEMGFSVVCLEQGEQENPDKYPSTTSDWELKKAKSYSPVAATRNNKADYPVDDSNSPIAVCNYNAVGGSTILYSAHFPRFLKNDFNLLTNEGIYEDWPIEYEALIPYFELNEKEMSVSGLIGDPMYPEVHSLMPPIPIGQTGELIGRAFNEKGWHWWPSYAAIATRARNGRDACINLGPCNTGCPQGAKSSVDVTYLANAKRSGLKLITNATVSNLIVANGKVEGVNYCNDAGEKISLFANNVILAASAIGTPRILLNSIDTETGSVVGNTSGLVGKNLMIHPLGYVEGVFEHELDTDIGPQGCMIYSLEHYRNPENNFDLGYMMHVLRGTGPLESANSALAKRKLKFGEDLEDSFYDFYKKQVSISIICDDLPDPNNRVELSDEVDRHGIPGVKVFYEVSENTSKIMKFGMTNAKELLRVAGAKKTYAYGPVRNTGWHLMGTCKMGNDSATSVVNSRGKVHDVDGLFVVDSSCFVTGSCVNPANTIQAIALYLTDKIIEDNDQ